MHSRTRKIRRTTAVIFAAVSMLLGGCLKKKPTAATVKPSDVETFFKDYNEDVNVRGSFYVTENITLTNPIKNTTVTIPVTLDVFYAQTEDENKNRTIHGSVKRTMVNSGVTETYNDEFYTELDLRNNGKFSQTSWYNETMTYTEDREEITVEILPWTKTGHYDPISCALALANYNPKLFSDDRMETTVSGTSLSAPLLTVIDDGIIKDLIDAACIEGLEVTGIQLPKKTDTGEVPSDYDRALNDANVVYLYDTKPYIASATADAFIVEGTGVINGQSLNITADITMNTTFTNHGNVRYTETLVPNTIKTETGNSTNIGDLFGEPEIDPAEAPAIEVQINTEGSGQITAYLDGEEPMEFSDEEPKQSFYFGWEEPALIHLNAKADEGWTFEQWTLNGETLSAEAAADVTVEATGELKAIFHSDNPEEPAEAAEGTESAEAAQG